MKRTTTEITIEIEETVAARLHKQTSPATENDIREAADGQVVCPFCERAFPAQTKNQNQKSED